VKGDLKGAFLERVWERGGEGGLSALIMMRGWMFLGQFKDLRAGIVHEHDLRLLGDVDRGAFEDVPDEVLATVMSVIRRAQPGDEDAIAVQPTALDDRSRDSGRTPRKRAALLAQVGRYEFDPKGFEVIEGEPIVYWWTKEFLKKYAEAPKLGESHTVRYGLSTQNNTRWLRKPWEVARSAVMVKSFSEPKGWDGLPWVAYIKGSEGRAWCDEVRDVLLWRHKGLELA